MLALPPSRHVGLNDTLQLLRALSLDVSDPTQTVRCGRVFYTRSVTLETVCGGPFSYRSLKRQPSLSGESPVSVVSGLRVSAFFSCVPSTHEVRALPREANHGAAASPRHATLCHGAACVAPPLLAGILDCCAADW